MSPNNKMRPPSAAFAEWSRAAADAVDEKLAAILSSATPADSTDSALARAMQFAVAGGGKRIRPLLCLASAKAVDGDFARALSAAAAAELMHSYSLVHDDLPCMDDSPIRRGRPSCHAEFGEATALLAGDALQSLAFSVLAKSGLGMEAVAILADAAGIDGMAGGQAIDLASANRPLSADELRGMHLKKTGALILASLRLGAMCATRAKKSDIIRLEKFGVAFGLLFQVCDDILDEIAPVEITGKMRGRDRELQKATFATRLGIEGAVRESRRLHGDALAAVDGANFDSAHFRTVADFALKRMEEAMPRAIKNHAIGGGGRC